MTIVLDLLEGRYVALKSCASKVFKDIDLDENVEFIENSQKEALKELIKHGYIVSSRSNADNTKLVSNREKKLVKLPIPLLFIALKKLIRIKRISKKGNLSQYYYTLTRDSTSKKFFEVESKNLSSAINAFSNAEFFIVLPRAPADCLPRSIALYEYLKELGFMAKHHVGVSTHPCLNMHAWVNIDGKPILDDVGRGKTYTIISTT